MVEQPKPAMVEPWAESLFCEALRKWNGARYSASKVAARVIQTAFAEREAAKDAEIARLTRELNSEQSRRIEGFKVDEELMDYLQAHVAELVDVLKRIEPHLDAIICYASAMGEHEPNRIAHDVSSLIVKYRSAS